MRSLPLLCGEEAALQLCCCTVIWHVVRDLLWIHLVLLDLTGLAGFINYALVDVKRATILQMAEHTGQYPFG